MPEPVSGSLSPAIAERFHEIARLLRDADHLGAEARQELAQLTDEMGRALGSTAVSSAEASHLADSAAHLIDALNRKEPVGTLAAARDGLEKAVFAVESKKPFLAGIAHRLLEALANLGI